MHLDTLLGICDICTAACNVQSMNILGFREQGNKLVYIRETKEQVSPLGPSILWTCWFYTFPLLFDHVKRKSTSEILNVFNPFLNFKKKGKYCINNLDSANFSKYGTYVLVYYCVSRS